MWIESSAGAPLRGAIIRVDIAGAHMFIIHVVNLTVVEEMRHTPIRQARAAIASAAVALAALALPASGATFSYGYSDPGAEAADDFIVSTSNVLLYTEGSFRQYIPVTGGTTFAATTPGVITYRFDFGSDIVDSATLLTRNPVFTQSYSRGRNRIFGSRDGASWELLYEVLSPDPPPFEVGTGGGFNGPLPASLLGGTELWFRFDLYSYGPDVGCCGDAGRNTAQHSRYRIGSGTETFRLDADLADPPPVPLPAALPLLLAGLAGFAAVRRRRS